ISYRRNREQIGRVLRVLVDESADGQAVGRSYRDAPDIDGTVLIPTDSPVDGFVNVRITGAEPYDLVGELVD
ncbi:MAG: TRAM domain-containing protein, partial [Anaerolineae bacterium]